MTHAACPVLEQWCTSEPDGRVLHVKAFMYSGFWSIGVHTVPHSESEMTPSKILQRESSDGPMVVLEGSLIELPSAMACFALSIRGCTISMLSQGERFVPIYAALVGMKALCHWLTASAGRWLVVHSESSDILAHLLVFTDGDDSTSTMDCIY